MFKRISNKIKFWWQVKKSSIFIKFVKELRQFTTENADNPTLDKRIWSLYYFLGQHKDYDSLIISLNRFLKVKNSYTREEIIVIRLLLLKLELPLLWLNRIIYPVKTE